MGARMNLWNGAYSKAITFWGDGMKRMAIIWVLYVCFAVILLPTWLTIWMGGFENEEIVYEDAVIAAMEWVEW